MPSKAEIEARMDLNNKPFKRALKQSQKSVKGFVGEGIKEMLRFGAVFLSLGLIKRISGMGTAAAETASKFRAVFGPSAEYMTTRIKELKKSIPATTMEMQNALATFGQMGRSFGLNADAANEFSINMVKIAGDLASFHNMAPEQAFEKIRSAISGEFEPLKQLGIIINETTLKQEALNLKIWDGTGQMSAAQKAMTVQSIILKQMGTAQGDAAATADSAANKIKFLHAKLGDMGLEIGTTILPAVVSLVEGFTSLVNVAQSAAEAVGTFLGERVYGDGPEAFKAFEDQAKGQLEEEGALTGKRGDEKKIEARAKQLLKEFEARQKAKKAAKEQAAAEAGVTAAVTDPAREKAGEEYIDSLNKQIELAGKLESIQSAKPGQAATEEKARMEEQIKKMKLEALKAEVRGEEKLAERMRNRIELAERILKIQQETNASHQEAVIIANQQLRAEKSGEKSKGWAAGEDPLATGKIQTGRIGDGMRNMPTMRERERAAGLYNTTLGRDGSALDGMARPNVAMASSPSAKDRAAADKTATTDYAAESARSLKVIESEMTKPPPKV